MAPAMGKAKTPCELTISELNSMAFGLAVYASQGWLPSHHARLASGRWSGATGRAFHPQGSIERFQSCLLTSLPPFPSWAWRNPIKSSRVRRLINETRFSGQLKMRHQRKRTSDPYLRVRVVLSA